MFTKFKVDWTSTSSKTTLNKNFNLKRDTRTNERTEVQNIMPIKIKDFGFDKKIILKHFIIKNELNSQ